MDGRVSVFSSGTRSASAGPSFTSISPRSTTLIGPFSPRSFARGDSRDGARDSIAACRCSARARQAICTRSSILLYPWLQTWQAFNLDTVLSVWLTGVGTYCWLRRHVGPAARAHRSRHLRLQRVCLGPSHSHEHDQRSGQRAACDLGTGKLVGERPMARSCPGRSVALACEVFAGHLQDSLLTIGLVALYGIYRTATERGTRGTPALAGHADRLGRAGRLDVGSSVGPLQGVARSLAVRRRSVVGRPDLRIVESRAIADPGTPRSLRHHARDTDWMDGFYPYHEMNTYMGLTAIVLAVVGAGGRASGDRWSSFWVLLIGLGSVLMLGKYTCLFDFAHRLPVLGSSREPVRFHVWVSLGVAALAATGVERLGRPGVVSLRGGLILAGVLVALSIPIMIFVYAPVWTQPGRWTLPYHLDRYRWLGASSSPPFSGPGCWLLWPGGSRAVPRDRSTRSDRRGGPRSCRYWCWLTS